MPRMARKQRIVERLRRPLTLAQRDGLGVRGARQQAAAAVEFALILPLLMTVIFGCVDLGRFAATSIALAGAARAGAGFGSDHPYTPATYGLWQSLVQQAVTNELTQDGFANDQLTVTAVTSAGIERTQRQGHGELSVPHRSGLAWTTLVSDAATNRGDAGNPAVIGMHTEEKRDAETGRFDTSGGNDGRKHGGPAGVPDAGAGHARPGHWHIPL